MGYSSVGPNDGASSGNVLAPGTHGNNELAIWDGVNTRTLKSSPNAMLDSFSGTLAISGTASTKGVILPLLSASPAADTPGFGQIYLKDSGPSKIVLRTSDGTEYPLDHVPGGISDHFDLDNLQGGNALERYHLSLEAYTRVQTGFKASDTLDDSTIGAGTVDLALDSLADAIANYSNANLPTDDEKAAMQAAGGGTPPTGANPFVTLAEVGSFGGGTVTSVGITAANGLTASGSPITGAGSIALGVNAVNLRNHLQVELNAAADQTAKNSIQIDADSFQLVGDTLNPGNSKYYGTNISGVRGYHDLPTTGPTAGASVVAVTAATGTAGAAAEYSRADHRHQVSVGTPGGITIGATAAAGGQASLSRSDHTHSLAAPGAPADVTKATADAGASSAPARADHKHDVSTAIAVGLAPGGASAEGNATTLARSNHTHALPAFGTGSTEFARGDHGHTTLPDALQKAAMDGADSGGAGPSGANPFVTLDEVGALGGGTVTSVTVNGSNGIEATGNPVTGAGAIALSVNATDLRNHLQVEINAAADQTGKNSIEIDADAFQLVGDLLNPGNSKYYGTNVSGVRGYYDLPPAGGTAGDTVTASDAGAGVSGADTEYSRRDHKHQVSVGLPVPVGIADTQSAGTNAALARSDHRHAAPPMAAGPATDGFMSGADKARLDNLDAADVGADPAGTASTAITSHEATRNHPVATTGLAGLMSSGDKVKADRITIANPLDLDVVAGLASGAIPSSEKGLANGVATLDVSGLLPISQLPISVMELKGSWNATTNTPTLIDGTGNPGDLYLVTVAGTQDLGSGSTTYVIGDRVIYDGSVWIQATDTDTVGTTGDAFAISHPSAGHTAGQISGLSAAATAAFGTGAGEVAAGDHSHTTLPDALQKAAMDAADSGGAGPSGANPFVTLDEVGALGGGTVTSVGITGNNGINVAGSPITGAGAITLSITAGTLLAHLGITDAKNILEGDSTAFGLVPAGTSGRFYYVTNELAFYHDNGSIWEGPIGAGGAGDVTAALSLAADELVLGDGSKAVKTTGITAASVSSAIGLAGTAVQPADLSGYTPIAHVGTGGVGVHALAVSGGDSGFMSGTDKEKLDRVTIAGPQNIDTIASLASDAIPSSEKGAIGGVAQLDGAGKVPSSQLPLSVLEYKGGWNATTNSPDLTEATYAGGGGLSGDTYSVTVAGTRDLGSGSEVYALGDRLLWTGAAWVHEVNTDEVGATGDAFATSHPAAGHTIAQITNLTSELSAKLDEAAHDALPQDNPHSVTAAQVGLGNVPNVDWTVTGAEQVHANRYTPGGVTNTVAGSGQIENTGSNTDATLALVSQADATFLGRALGAGAGSPVPVTAANVKTALALVAGDVGLGNVPNVDWTADGPEMVHANRYVSGTGGQTNTVQGDDVGIQNTGTDVAAVLAPIFGTTAGTIAQGNDGRFIDARTPLAHAIGGAEHQSSNFADFQGLIPDAKFITDLPGELAAILPLKGAPAVADLILIEDSAGSLFTKSYTTLDDLPLSSAAVTALGDKIPTTEKGANNGVATLDGSGKVPLAQIPDGVAAQAHAIGGAEHLSSNFADFQNLIPDAKFITDLPNELATLLPLKNVPVVADLLVIEDSAAAYSKSYITVNSLPLSTPMVDALGLKSDTGHDHAGVYAPIAHVGAGAGAHALAVALGDAGFMSGTDKAKLDAITGTNTGDQTITLTGDITGSGTGSFATTIAAGAVDIPMINATGTPGSGNYLRGDGAWGVPTPPTITLTGDVTGTGSGSFATTIAAGAVDMAMLNASGTADGTTYLRGDGTWDTPAGSGITAVADLATLLAIDPTTVSGEFYYAITEHSVQYSDGTAWAEAGVVADGNTIEVDATNGLQLVGFPGASTGFVPRKTVGGSIEWADVGGGGGLGPWTFSSATTATDPGAGGLKFSDVPTAPTLNLYISQSNDLGRDVLQILDLMLAVDDYIILRGSSGVQNLYKLTSVQTDNGGWSTISLSPLDAGAIADGATVELSILTRRASFATMAPGSVDDLSANLYDCTIGGVLVGDIPKLTLNPTTSLPALPPVDGGLLTGLPNAIPDESLNYNWTGIHGFTGNVSVNGPAPVGLSIVGQRLLLDSGVVTFKNGGTRPTGISSGRGYLWHNGTNLIYTDDTNTDFALVGASTLPVVDFYQTTTPATFYPGAGTILDSGFGVVTPSAGTYMVTMEADVSCTLITSVTCYPQLNGYATSIAGADRQVTIGSANARVRLMTQYKVVLSGSDVLDFLWVRGGSGTTVATLYNRSLSVMRVVA